MTDEFSDIMRRFEYGEGYDDLYAKEDPSIYDLIRGGSRKGYHRLRIVRADGSYFSIHHDDVHTLEGTADGTALSLCIRGGLIVTVKGERLVILADYLEECRVRKLYAFDPKKHRFKEGADRERVPVIHEIREDMTGR